MNRAALIPAEARAKSKQLKRIFAQEYHGLCGLGSLEPFQMQRYFHAPVSGLIHACVKASSILSSALGVGAPFKSVADPYCVPSGSQMPRCCLKTKTMHTSLPLGCRTATWPKVSTA